MAVPYKIKKTTGTFAETDKWKAVVDEYETIGLDWLSRQIVRGTSMTSGDLIGALVSLNNEMAEQLMAGRRVHLPGLGYFSLAVKGDLYEDPKTGKMRLRNAQVRTVKFRPDRQMMEALCETKFENATYRDGFYDAPTDEEIDAALVRLFDAQEVVVTSRLLRELGVSRSVGYRLVKRLEAEGKLRNVGTPHRKIFMRGTKL